MHGLLQVIDAFHGGGAALNNPVGVAVCRGAKNKRRTGLVFVLLCEDPV